jgi:hypothetical protein
MITEQQFTDAAKTIGCKVSTIKAVYFVETAGHGYLADGRVKILFEGHRFWKQLKKAGANPAKFIAGNQYYSNVVYESWNKSHYKGGAAEWNRVSLAIEVCSKLGVSPLLALNSTSFGSFQIMGENCLMAGYATSQEMLAAFNIGGEAEQLKAFVNFVKARKLDDELRDGNFKAFADGYNGTQSRQNRYAERMEIEDKRYSMAA